jgi:hypothetical protein
LDGLSLDSTGHVRADRDVDAAQHPVAALAGAVGVRWVLGAAAAVSVAGLVAVNRMVCAPVGMPVTS